MVEKKFGRFTRDVQDLELVRFILFKFLISFNSSNLNLIFKVEYDLSEYEKRKIAEEKQRLAMTKYETNILLIIYLQSITLSLKKK